MLKSYSVPIAVLLFIIIPFLVFGKWLEAYSIDLIDRANGIEIAFAAIILLAADVLLPIPSSIVSLAAAAALSAWAGAAVIWMGMSLGAVLGGMIGKGLLGPIERQLANHPEKALGLVSRWGWIGLIALRPVPVLAEASVLIAAARGMPLGKLSLLTALANIPVALLYGYFGALVLGDVPLGHLLLGVGVASVTAAALDWRFGRKEK